MSIRNKEKNALKRLFIHQRIGAEFFTNYVCAELLNRNFDCRINYYRNFRNPIFRLVLSLYLSATGLVQIISGRKLVYQFPPKIEVIPLIFLSQIIRRPPISIVHDLDYLRKITNHGLLFSLDPKGFRMLRYSDVIVHQGRMWDLLVQHNVQPKAYIKFWPYLLSHDIRSSNTSENSKEISPTILYAGNLVKEKCGFLEDIGKLNRHIDIYGQADFINKHKCISIHPPFKEKEPPKIVTPTFGLIWDGDSLNGLEGLYGEYQKLNLPAKLSLYLAMGIPVIVSTDSNMARFVLDSGIGICVNNLYEIPHRFESNNWNSMVKKCHELSEEVTGGFDFIRAFKQLQN